MNDSLKDGRAFLKNTYLRQLLPAIISLAGVMVSTMANSILAGNLLGHEALAVMGVVSPIYFLFATVGALVGVGGSALAAWSIGQGKIDGAHRAFTFSCILTLGISAVISGLGLLLLDPFVFLLGGRGALFEPVRQYAFFFLLSGVGTTGIYLPFNFLKLEGRMRLSMALFVLMAVLNIGLDLLFVLPLHMGIAGIAIATGIASIVSAGLGMLVLLMPGSSFRLCSVKGHWRAVGKLMVAGSPASLNNLVTTLRTICLNLILVPLAGSAGLSALSILSTAGNLALAVVSGVGQTTAPFVGVFSKERDNASIRQIEWIAMTRGGALTLAAAILFVLFASPFCLLFGIRDPAVLELSAPAVRIFAISLVPSLISTVLLTYYQASGFTWIANVFTVCRAFAFVVLTALVLSPVLGLAGVWMSFSVAELLSWGVLWLCLRRARRGRPERTGLLLLDRRHEGSGRYCSFSVRSEETDVMNASTRISDFCEQNELDPRRTMLISLALEEMLLSICSHCFHGSETQEINVRLLILPDDDDMVIVLRIRCAGEAFNPIAYYEANRKENPEEFDDSIGIRMIVGVAQAVDYKTTFGVNNLTIIL